MTPLVPAGGASGGSGAGDAVSFTVIAGVDEVDIDGCCGGDVSFDGSAVTSIVGEMDGVAVDPVGKPVSVILIPDDDSLVTDGCCVGDVSFDASAVTPIVV